MLSDALVLITVGALAAILPRSQGCRRYLTRQLADQVSATVPAGQTANLESRVARRAMGMGTGILVAGLLVLVVDRLWEAPESMTGLGLILSLMFVYGAAGSAVVEIWRPGSPAEGPRTARATSIAIPVLVGLSWLAVRRVLHTAQPARDESELYWQDPVRAQTVSSLAAPTPLVMVGPWGTPTARYFRDRLWGGQPPTLASEQVNA